MSRRTIRVSDVEAASDFASLLARVRAGAEVVIEHDAQPIAIVQPADGNVRRLSESLLLAKKHASSATLDSDFAHDVNAAIESHPEPLSPPEWD